MQPLITHLRDRNLQSCAGWGSNHEESVSCENRTSQGSWAQAEEPLLNSPPFFWQSSMEGRHLHPKHIIQLLMYQWRGAQWTCKASPNATLKFFSSILIKSNLSFPCKNWLKFTLKNIWILREVSFILLSHVFRCELETKELHCQQRDGAEPSSEPGCQPQAGVPTPETNTPQSLLARAALVVLNPPQSPAYVGLESRLTASFLYKFCSSLTPAP